MVATYTTFRALPPIFMLGRQSGCPYIWPSTRRSNNLPNVAGFTFVVLSVVSSRFAPVRALSLCCVVTETLMAPPERDGLKAVDSCHVAKTQGQLGVVSN